MQAHASAAKSAVDSLTRSLALEWGEFGIRTNGIAPGIVTGTPGKVAMILERVSQDSLSSMIDLSLQALPCIAQNVVLTDHKK